MIRKVRSKVASSLSKIDEAEDFNYISWLKKPSNEQYSIDPIETRLTNVEDIILDFVLPEFSKVDLNLDEPLVTNELKDVDFKRVRSNTVFFMIPKPGEQGVLRSEVELVHQSYSARIIEFLLSNPHQIKVKVKFDSTPPQQLECRIDTPGIYDFLPNEIPRVYNIDLLEFDEFISSSKKKSLFGSLIDSAQKAFSGKPDLPTLPKLKKILKIKIPPIGNYKVTDQKIDIAEFVSPRVSKAYPILLAKLKNYYAHFQIPKPDSFLFYTPHEHKVLSEDKENVSGRQVSSKLKEQLAFILSSIKKVDWEKTAQLHLQLRQYEETAARFLVENDFALLQDEFGLDIEKEIIGALKILFGNGLINSAVIITPARKIGNTELAKHLNVEIGWSDKLKRYCPELSVAVIKGDIDERTSLWNNSKSINIADTEDILNDYHLKILDDSRLHRYDCIVLDEANMILQSKEKGKKFISSIAPKILWATSSVLDKNLRRELNSWLDETVRIDKILIRNKESIREDSPAFIINEVWFEADEDQKKEFETCLTDCRKDLKRVLESGNPLRLMANIFTFVHRLNQVGNFASGKSRSPKTDLLLEQLMNIKANGKKALIISQYERQGLKKIEDLLIKYGIKHILAPGGLSVQEMKQTIASFNSKKDYVAFVSDAKTSRLKFTDIDVSYVIRFDQWWNPISGWELEDMFTTRGEEDIYKESINIYNYFSMGTVDQKVKELFLKNDLLNRNIFELMQPKLYEELITVDEWLQIFGMPAGEKSKSEQTPASAAGIIKSMPEESFRKILTRFFTLLGYSHLDIIELPNSNSFNIVGKAQRNSRVFSLVARVFNEEKVDKKTLENILSEIASSGNNKFFFISKGSLPVVSQDLKRRNVSLLDCNSLSKFLIRLGITPANEGTAA
jgi:hypothetical protein